VLAIRHAPALAALLLASSAAAAPAAETCPPGMKRVPGGYYELAHGEDANVDSFCLDVTEVTVSAYARCVDAGACKAEKLDCGSAATWVKKGAAAHPVNCVDWFEADAFCKAHGKRLPTEEEWEWAARGGRRALTFPWGADAPSNRACWDGDGNTKGKGERKETCPVGTHRRARSPDGLEDLAGNVREWTATELEEYRVLRGGSWGDSLPEFLSSGFRGWNAPDDRMELIGFRCAAELGARTRVPKKEIVKPQAVMQDDGVLVMPYEIRPSRPSRRN
jgi:formylglycine-generating enzyme required for sulfatase activity